MEKQKRTPPDKAEENLHKRHRQRLKARFLAENLSLANFNDHTKLELFLYYALPQKDTNPIAHRLLNKFETLQGVFDASVEELCTIDGISSHAALLFKIAMEINRYYMISINENQAENLDSINKIGRYMLPFFHGKQEEHVYVLTLSASMVPIRCNLLFKGSINSASINARMIVELALSQRAAGVVIAHNHPGGLALPSTEDINTTYNIHKVLTGVGIHFVDHILVAGTEFVSFMQSNFLPNIQQ